MYTQEQNEEIRKVINVFDDYIRETPYFDIVWSINWDMSCLMGLRMMVMTYTYHLPS